MCISARATSRDISRRKRVYILDRARPFRLAKDPGVRRTCRTGADCPGTPSPASRRTRSRNTNGCTCDERPRRDGNLLTAAISGPGIRRRRRGRGRTVATTLLRRRVRTAANPDANRLVAQLALVLAAAKALPQLRLTYSDRFRSGIVTNWRMRGTMGKVARVAVLAMVCGRAPVPAQFRLEQVLVVVHAIVAVVAVAVFRWRLQSVAHCLVQLLQTPSQTYTDIPVHPRPALLDGSVSTAATTTARCGPVTPCHLPA